MRQLLAVVAAGAVAAVAALILGEYELAGWVPLAGGVVIGVAVGEVIATLARPPDVPLTAAGALLAAAAMLWAVWISTGRGVRPADPLAWVGVATGPLTASLWLRAAVRRGPRTPDQP